MAKFKQIKAKMPSVKAPKIKLSLPSSPMKVGISMKKPKLGTGARFKALKTSLSKKGATNPEALAAWIGRKKFGVKKFASLAKKGKMK